MKSRTMRTTFMGGAAFAALLAGLSTPAFAADQTTKASPADATTVTVTGTRIRRPNIKSNSPITTVDAKEITAQAATTIETVLNNMPQVTSDATESTSNGSDGTSQVNLRNLGSNRNLVLIDGQRELPAQAGDLNFIPTAMVERIDVVTGGASAVYGSDAISGVVNFIMKKNLSGIHLDAQYGYAEHTNDNTYLRSVVTAKGFALAPKSVNDAGKYTVNLSGGFNTSDGKGNISGFVGYRKAEPVTEDSRDYSACALSMATESSFACGGSSNTTYGKITSTDASSPSYLTPVANNPDGSKTFVPYTGALAYNYAPTNYIQRSDKRISAGLFGHYTFNSAAEIYGSFIAMKDRTFSQVAPSAIWQGTDFTINCDNPLMSAAQKTALCGSTTSTANTTAQVGFRFAGSPRRDDLRHEDYRGTFGIRGHINDNISYDVNYLQSVVFYNETYTNDVDQLRAAKALQAVSVNGVATCKSVIDGTDKSCVPADIFSKAGPSSAGLDYLFVISHTHAASREQNLSANLNIDLGGYGVKSPFADDGVASAFGGESRIDSLNFVNSAIALQNGGTNADGRVSTNEVYTEFNVPLVQNKPWIKDLTVDMGLRQSTYTATTTTASSPTKSTTTYKIDGQYAPNQDLRFRASFNQAIRAPNISELFSPQGQGNVTADDPCGSAKSATLAQCQLSGLNPSQYGSLILDCPAQQCTQRYGGNPDLDPEKAKTYTFGFVYTPTAHRNFTFSADYYHIRVDGYISSVDPTLILNQCLTTGNSFFCALIHRNPKSGIIYGTDGYIISTSVNTGYLQTAGVDLNANYALDLADIFKTNLGRLNFAFTGTYLTEMATEPLPGLGKYDCKGLFGPTCGNPSPTWRHTLRTTWNLPWSDSTISANWRHLDQTKLSSNTSDPFLAGTTSIINSQIKAYDYLDLSASYKFAGRYTLRANINNLLDKSPPAIATDVLTGFGNGNTYPGTYDPLGRVISIGLTADF